MRIFAFTFSLIAFLLVSWSLCAQTSYPQGVYLTFKDRQLKTPSHTFHAAVEQRKRAPLYLLGGNDYRVRSHNIKRKEIRMDWLAYSDGTDLFMNCYPIGLQSHYSKVLIEGEYLFFNSGIKESTVTAILFGLVGGVISSWIIAGKGVHMWFRFQPEHQFSCARSQWSNYYQLRLNFALPT